MTVARTATTVTTGLFTLLAGIAGLVALYQWATYLLVWGTTWDLANALMWTTITVVVFLPVVGLHLLTRGGE